MMALGIAAKSRMVKKSVSRVQDLLFERLVLH
jgi:hypothetical protein